MHLSGAFSDLSDTDLDALYASTYASFKNATGQVKITWAQSLAFQGMEIADRLMNFKDFVFGVFGRVRFPRYDAIQKSDPSIGGFQQSTVAQEELKTSAGNVSSNIASTVKWGMGGAAVVGVGLIALYIIMNRRK